jgi:MFS family permease
MATDAASRPDAVSVSIVDLLIGIALLAAGQGASGTLVAMRLSGNESAFAAGAVGAAYFAGMLCGIFVVVSIVARVGPIRAFTAAAGALALSLAGLTALDGAVPWALCRALAGASMASLYATTEYWLSARSSSSNRGRVLSLYAVTLYLALSFGQVIVSLPEVDGDARRLAFASMLAAAGVIPVALTRAHAPAWPRSAQMNLRGLMRTAPVGIVAATSAGVMCGALVSLGPLAVHRAGFDDRAVAAFMAAVWGGGLLVQVPIGRASDRWGRRPVLAAVGILSALGSIAIGVAQASRGGAMGAPALVALTAVAGGFAFAFYPLGAAYTLDRVEAEGTAAANRGLLLVYAIGSAAGPLAASAIMDAFGAPMLFGFQAAVALGTVAFTLFRLSRFALLPSSARSRVTLVPRTSLVASTLDPRSSSHPDSGTR